MKDNAYLILEIGDGQLSDCKEFFSVSSLKFNKNVNDLQKKDRIMVFSKL